MKLKSTLSIFIIAFFLFPIFIFAQGGWKQNNVTIKGKVNDFQNHKKSRTINFTFYDVISQSEKNIYVAEIDSLGNFLIQIPINYLQDFYLRSDYGDGHFVCLVGDELILNINYKTKTANLVGGNRVKDNNDFKNFLIGLNGIDDKSTYELAKFKNSSDFLLYCKNRSKKINLYFDTFKKQFKTSKIFNQFIKDYIKYESLNTLLVYPSWHALQNKINKDSLKLIDNYYAFLEEYNMGDGTSFSTMHVQFLNNYYNYVTQHPKEAVIKVNNYISKGDIILAANVWKNLILQKTSGFTRNLFLTRFYQDIIEGKQLRLFDAIYDSTDLTDSYFTSIIDRNYKLAQDFLANQNTNGANLKKINSEIVKDLLDTITTKYANKVIYIDFWATWCSPCLAEIPNSKLLQQEYKDKDIVFLFLANRSSEDAWKATIANKELTGEHILLTNDQYNILAAKFNITGIPHYVLIDKQGNIISKNAPRPSPKNQIKLEINRLLK